jgi:hypothetical protein
MKTQVIVHGGTERPTLFIDNRELEVVDQFTYLGSTVNNKLSLDQEINIRVGKAVTTINRLTKRVWVNRKLTLLKNPCLTSMCFQHPPLRQCNMVSLHLSGDAT